MKQFRERTHVYYEKTINKFAMISRQPDIGLRQECTGPGQVVGPTWRKMNKFSSWSLGGEGDRVAPGRLAHPYTRRCGRRRSGREQRCLT